MTDNKTTFTWNDKTYQLEIDPTRLYNLANPIVKLPNGELLKIEQWRESYPPIPVFSNVFNTLINATEVDKEELTFQNLLKEYELTDNSKTRKLWGKCYDEGHAYGLEEVTSCFHKWVDLILD